MWVSTIPVLSTAHITLETRNVLSAMAQNNHDCAGVLRCAEYDEGYFVHLDLEHDSTAVPMLADIAALHSWALKKAYQWVRLDADGDVVDELPQHDW